MQRGETIRLFLLLTTGILVLMNMHVAHAATSDCVDDDEDGYYDEDCTIDDLGCVNETEYVTDSAEQQTVDAYGDYIVYADDSSGNVDIYLYNVEDATTKQLSTSSAPDINPAIYNDHVVWQSLDSGSWDIVLYDIDTASATTITTEATHEVSPAIYDDTVIWSDNRGTDWNIYSYSISTATTRALVNESGNQSYPRIFDDKIVYQTDSGGKGDIYMYDIDSRDATQITSGTAKDIAPDTDGDYIVWQSAGTYNWDLYAYDISTQDTFVISDNDGNQRLASIDGGKVVWMDDRDGNFNIFYYDIAANETAQLTDDENHQVSPKITNSMVYWIDLRNGNGDIFGTSVEEGCDAVTGDCDDTDDTVYPAANETCDSVDNDCDDEIDEEEDCEEEEVTCFLEGTGYQLWVDESFSSVINAAGDGETVYAVSYGDGTCEVTSMDFYVYSTYYDDTTRAYYTNELIESLSGTMENYPDENYDIGYGDITVTWPDEDTYYYFIGVIGNFTVVGDTLLVCESSDDCTGESVTIVDAEDYAASLIGAVLEETECETDDDCLSLYGSSAYTCQDGTCAIETECSSDDTCNPYACDVTNIGCYTSCTVDEECTNGYVCTEGICAEEEIDCSSQWDCSNVEWSECVDGIQTLDLNACQTLPTDDVCYDEENLPEYERDCEEETVEVEIGIEESTEEVTTTEEVPFFTWLNLILVLAILISYYAYKHRR